jgi:hypothetical protein
MLHGLRVSDCTDSSSAWNLRNFVQTILLCLYFACCRVYVMHIKVYRNLGVFENVCIQSKQGPTFAVFDSPGQVTKYCRCGRLWGLYSLRLLTGHAMEETGCQRCDLVSLASYSRYPHKGLDGFSYKIMNCVGWNASCLANTRPRYTVLNSSQFHYFWSVQIQHFWFLILLLLYMSHDS